MSGLALMLKQKGISVEGSDINDSSNVKMLKEKGIEVFIGHSGGNLKPDVQLVTFSSAIRPDNPELKEAAQRGIPVMGRGKLLAELLRNDCVIAVAGSHGKTTVSGMISWLMDRSGISSCGFVGGHFLRDKMFAWHKDSELVVVETDESDASFLEFSARIAVVTNIDREHLNFYGSYENVIANFKKFLDKSRIRILCYDDPVCRSFSLEDTFYYGLSGGDITADIESMSNQGTVFKCSLRGRDLGAFRIPVIGKHNVLNSLPAIFLGMRFGVETYKIKECLASFPGIKRRLEFKGKLGTISVYDDYAHHPNEIRRSLEAFKDSSSSRIVLLFQPHRFSRLKALFDDFVDCFGDADYLVLTDIYSAQEEEIEGTSSRNLYEAIRKKNPEINAVYLHKEDIPDFIVNNGILRDNDILVTMGAGDVYKLWDSVKEIWGKNV